MDAHLQGLRNGEKRLLLAGGRLWVGKGERGGSGLSGGVDSWVDGLSDGLSDGLIHRRIH